MKKVMIGILILIPILILVIVAAVSNFLKIVAWIAVDDIAVVYKDTDQEADSITLEFKDNQVLKFTDFVDVKVMPDYANRYSIEWRISGDVECMDEGYQKEYDKYLVELEAYNKYLADVGYDEEQIRILEQKTRDERRKLELAIIEIKNDTSLSTREKEAKIAELQSAFNAEQADRDAKIKQYTDHKNSLVKPEVGYVAPPAMLVDDNGNEVSSNTTGKFAVNSYCRFNVIIQVESISKTLSVNVEGYDVESITIVNLGEDDSTIGVGEKMRVDAKFNPLTSKVSDAIWWSEPIEDEGENVLTVDQNGVITALNPGKAKVFVKASVFSSEGADKKRYVDSEEYVVTVVAGVSKYGANITTSRTNLKLSDLELTGTVDAVASDGCTIVGDDITITESVAHIVTNNGTVTVTICGANDIAIENAEIYDATNGYVFAISDLTLKLKAVWADMLKEGTPEGVVWTAKSEGNIVSVANGEVTASASGLAEIEAKLGDSTAKIVLNVQIKLVSMKLRTSNDYFTIGLALETVFAAEKYKDVSVNNEKEPNSTLIQIIGAPKRLENESENSFMARLAVFYTAFNYEVVEGSEYAHFAENEAEPNRLIFNPSALEGKGKTTVKVKVSAKYPKYESAVKFTEETVDIKVIYGVEVSNIAEFRQAAEDQKTYANMEGNLQESKVTWEHTNTAYGRNDKYSVQEAPYSLRTYGMCVAGDIAYGANEEVGYGTIIYVYGDIYGNAHRFGGEKSQMMDKYAELIRIAWSNVTVSNFYIRANKMEKDGTLSADEASGLKGECIAVASGVDYYKYRITGVRIEYSILENACRAGEMLNADCTIDGVVVRNLDNTAFYVPSRMNPHTQDDGTIITHPMYSHINMNNCVFSNCIGTIGSYSYERFTIMADAGYAWTPYDDCKAGDGRFVRKDLVANAEYFKEHFLSAGINTQVRQTGFLDIYNWQNVQNANLIDVGDAETNKLIGSFASGILKGNPEFEKCRYDVTDTEMYFHMGILSTGITFDQGIMDEPSYFDITFEDTRFSAPIRTKGMPVVSDSITGVAESLISKMEIVFYGYSKDADITPYSSFDLTRSYIENHLHKKA